MLEKERKLYEQQIQRFLKRIKTLYYENEATLQAEYCKFKPHTPVYGDRLSGQYKPIKVGGKWGKNWEQAWFHITGEVPAACKGSIAAVRINLGGEGCIFDDEGVPKFALSFHSLWMTDFRRDRYIISRRARGGEKIDLWIDATASQLFGLQLFEDAAEDDPKKFGHYEATIVDLAVGTFREDIWQLYLDMFVLDNLMLDLPEDSVRRARILAALSQSINDFNTEPDTIATLRSGLAVELKKRSNASALNAVAVGHAHIDTAWLWPLAETRKKCVRSFTAQLDLIKKYPGYVFGASQAQHYQFIKEDHPAIYRKIKQQVKAGTWEIQGGMWLEADCNLISGESMVRQFLHGMNFFQKEFGVRVKNLWLPDVFGYSAAMPQILSRFGIKEMVTQKISWSQFNKFPNHTFVWRGIDGSEIVVHFPPEDSYNSELKPSGMRYAQKNFAEKAIVDDFLIVFGIGDGGGGPTEEIIEAGIRQNNLEGTPRVKFSAAQPLLDKFSRQREKLPRWVGELYLELHRGTLTSQAYNKKMNRYMELKLRELEFLYAAFQPKQYPQTQFDEMWKTVLLNQFHDVIPGSSINIVYKDSHRQYRELEHQAETLSAEFQALASNDDAESFTLVNTLSFTYCRPVHLPAKSKARQLVDDSGNTWPVQVIDGARVFIPELPPHSSVSFRNDSAENEQVSVTPPNKLVLENKLVRYEFDENGQIRRAYDKEARRDIIKRRQAGNVFCLYEDRPNDWDAWDIDIFYEKQLREHAALVSWSYVSQGELATVARLEFTVGNSTIAQQVMLCHNSKRLEFDTHVDWNEVHKMLRVGFTVDVHATEATYEIQYGHIKRPTHRNTSWDFARFEVVGHRFADLSDQLYGVGLLNDCKYGHKIHDNYIELNLLRAPNLPDPEADRGQHQFTYALLPHVGDFLGSEVLSEAHQLNQPAFQVNGTHSDTLRFPFELVDDGVIIEVFKKAENDQSFILRLYEPRGKHTQTQLRFRDERAEVMLANLFEEELKTLHLKDGLLSLRFDPFEIMTLKIRMSP